MEARIEHNQAIEILELRRIEDIELATGAVVIAEMDLRIAAAGLRINGARVVRVPDGRYQARLPASKFNGQYVFDLEDMRHMIDVRNEAIDMLLKAGVLEQF